MMISSIATHKKIDLHMWVMPNAGFDTRRILQTEINHFETLHPECRIHLTIIPWSQSWHSLVAFLKHEHVSDAPDVIQVGSTWAGTLAYLGILRNISDSFTMQNRKTFIRHALESCYYPRTDQLYAVPWFVDVRVLYYRADLLAHIRKKPQDMETWEGFLSVCEALRAYCAKEKHLYPLRLSGQRAGVLMHDMAPWIWGAGGAILSSDHRAAAFCLDKAFNGVKWYFDIIDSGIIPLVSDEGIYPEGSFFSGNYAMQFTGMWPLRQLSDHGHPEYREQVAKQYRVAMFPRGNAGRWSFFGGSHLAVTSFCKYPAEAIELVRFLVGEESQQRHGKAIGMFPSVKQSFDAMALLKPDIGGVFRESLQHARLMPQVLTLGTIEQIFGSTTEYILQLIRAKAYSALALKAELLRAAREADYILSLYET